MLKKTKKIVYLSIGYILLILFIEFIYGFFYSSIPQTTTPNANAIYLQVEAFMSPLGLSVVMSVLFVIAIVAVALFDSY